MFALLARLFDFALALLALRYIVMSIYRVLTGLGFRPGASGRSQSASPAPVNPSAGPAATLLHKDPVCGTYVAADTSLKQIIDGRVLHFCSGKCRDLYRA